MLFGFAFFAHDVEVIFMRYFSDIILGFVFELRVNFVPSSPGFLAKGNTKPIAFGSPRRVSINSLHVRKETPFNFHMDSKQANSQTGKGAVSLGFPF